jgi:hypothetical protein
MNLKTGIEFWQAVPEFNSCNALPSFDPAKVKFHLEWQNDSQIVPAKGIFALSEESSPQTWCEDKCAGHWTYELRIDSQNVPLQDNLAVRPMHLFGHNFDHDYHFELPRERDANTTAADVSWAARSFGFRSSSAT